MDNQLKKRAASRLRRKQRVRKKLKGNQETPRLTVSKTNRHLYVQLIDDEQGLTLAGVGTLSKENKGNTHNRKSKESAKHLGIQIAELAKKKGVARVIFDRGRYKYHGLLAEIANAARSGGLQF